MWNSPTVVFRDRREAGRLLAEKLPALRAAPNTVVLGLPRGGVVPAAEIARALELPLDVLISRKLRAPFQRELAIGAVAEGGEAFVADDAQEIAGTDDEYLASEIAEQETEMEHRRRLFRHGEALRLPESATVILVDDGIATGSTVIAAIRALRRLHVGRIILATPVAPPSTMSSLRTLVDETVVLRMPQSFRSVGQFYADFGQVSDEEVCALLAEAGRPSDQPAAGVPADGARP